MKYYPFLLLFLIPNTSLAQPGLFQDLDRVIYKNVFSQDFNEILQSSSEIKHLEIYLDESSSKEDSVYVIEIKNFLVRQAMEFVEMKKSSTPVYLAYSDIYIKVKLENKDGRFRLTSSEIFFTPHGGIVPQEINEFVFKLNGELRKKNFNKVKAILDQLMINIFETKMYHPEDDNW